MEDERRAPGRRLIQLALNDAVQSRLCLNSPIRSQLEKEKRDRRKVNRITIWTESNSQNPSLRSDGLVRESVNGFKTNTPEAKWNCHWNKSWPNGRNQNDPLPSSRNTFRDVYRSDFSNQCVKSNYNSLVPFNLSKSGSRDSLFSTTQSKTSNMMSSFTTKDCSWRDVKSNLAFPDFDGNNIDALSHKTSVNSQPVCPNYNYSDENIPTKQTKVGLNLNSNYDLPMLPQGCKLKGSRTSETPHEEDSYVSDIPKMSSDLLKHWTLHSLENSLRHSKKEPVSDFVGPPMVESRWLNASEQNNFSNSIEIPPPVEIPTSSLVEIPAPLDTTNQIYSSKSASILPAEEEFAGFCESSRSEKRSVNCDTSYLENNSSIKEHPLKSNPHFSTFKHFEGLIYDNQEKHSSFITVITDNLELKIVSNHSQLDSNDMECPISKPKRVNADYLVDSFLNLDSQPKHDETMTSNFVSALNGGIAFDNKLYATNTGDIFHPEVRKTSTLLFESDNEKNIPGKLHRGFHSSNLSEYFPNYDAPLSNINPEVSMSNPHTNENLTSNDELIYPGNFASKQCSLRWAPVTSLPALHFETLNQNCPSNSESKLPNSSSDNYSLFNPDASVGLMSSSESKNLPVNHFYNSNSDHCDKTNVLNPAYYNCKTSKLGKSVETLNSSSLEDSSRSSSNFHKAAVSHYGDDALKSRLLDEASGSLDSGIGLISDERECDSVWNLL